MPPQRTSRSAGEEVIEAYNPAIGRHHLVSPAEWRVVQSVVREAVAPFSCELTGIRKQKP